jgi:hypothetical protein
MLAWGNGRAPQVRIKKLDFTGARLLAWQTAATKPSADQFPGCTIGGVVRFERSTHSAGFIRTQNTVKCFVAREITNTSGQLGRLIPNRAFFVRWQAATIQQPCPLNFSAVRKSGTANSSHPVTRKSRVELIKPLFPARRELNCLLSKGKLTENSSILRNTETSYGISCPRLYRI